MASTSVPMACVMALHVAVVLAAALSMVALCVAHCAMALRIVPGHCTLCCSIVLAFCILGGTIVHHWSHHCILCHGTVFVLWCCLLPKSRNEKLYAWAMVGCHVEGVVSGSCHVVNKQKNIQPTMQPWCHNNGVCVWHSVASYLWLPWSFLLWKQKSGKLLALQGAVVGLVLVITGILFRWLGHWHEWKTFF